jgi:heme/copper-type cytochrome/quinol oxidase subunit 2
MSWIYLKASIEVPFLFQVGLYVKDNSTVVTIRKQHRLINIVFWTNIAFLLISTILLIIIEHVGNKDKSYDTYDNILLVTTFIEIIVILATISFALIRIYRAIWKIKELRVNKALMLLHLLMFMIYTALFTLECVVYFNLAFKKADATEEVGLLSSLFIIKLIIGTSIYFLLLFMLVKIVSPVRYVNLKMEHDSEDEQEDEITQML